MSKLLLGVRKALSAIIALFCHPGTIKGVRCRRIVGTGPSEDIERCGKRPSSTTARAASLAVIVACCLAGGLHNSDCMIAPGRKIPAPQKIRHQCPLQTIIPDHLLDPVDFHCCPLHAVDPCKERRRQRYGQVTDSHADRNYKGDGGKRCQQQRSDKREMPGKVACLIYYPRPRAIAASPPFQPRRGCFRIQGRPVHDQMACSLQRINGRIASQDFDFALHLSSLLATRSAKFQVGKPYALDKGRAIVQDIDRRYPSAAVPFWPESLRCKL